MASNTNTADLSISDLANVLAALTEVTKPYQLGIQLKIDSSELDVIEGNHPRDIDRQKTEVVKYWLRNSPGASWTTLANAMERMGGHARLAETLREREEFIIIDNTELEKYEEQIHENPMFLKPLSRQKSNLEPVMKIKSQTRSLDMCVRRNILLLGKMGHGTSTLGNRMLCSDGWFKINDQQCPQTSQGSAMIKSASQLKDYKIEVYDHTGLFQGASSINRLSFAVPGTLNLVMFVLKHDCDFDESEVAILKSVMSEWQISEISALALTHCESLSEEERGEVIEQFKKDHPSIAKLMGKGILAVGFPDSSHVQPGSPLSQRVEEDKANLRKLIYSCDEFRFILKPPQSESKQHLQNENEQCLQTGVKSRQPLQNSYCPIL